MYESLDFYWNYIDGYMKVNFISSISQKFPFAFSEKISIIVHVICILPHNIGNFPYFASKRNFDWKVSYLFLNYQAMAQQDLALFEELFAASPEIKYPREGEVIRGEIIKIEKKNILINVNNQFSGLVISKEIGNTVDIATLVPWVDVEVMVLGDSVERGLLILSLKRANQIKSLSHLTAYRASEEVITVRPTEANKWGLLVDIDGLKGFIPVSQLTPVHYPRVEWADPQKILEHLQGLLGKEFKVKVINVDEGGKKIIFSEKAAISENREKALGKLKVGDVVEGTVSGILTYGLFITFDGLEGLVHVSEIDWGHVNDPSKFAKVGEKLKVKVIGLDNDKISLSVKRLQENPWDILARKYKVWDIIKAPISRISQFGAFIELDWGIQGLIHLSEVAHENIEDIRNHIHVGEEISAKIINFEPKEKRIGLSIKVLSPAPKRAPKTEDKKTESPKVEEKAEKKSETPKEEKGSTVNAEEKVEKKTTKPKAEKTAKTESEEKPKKAPKAKKEESASDAKEA